MVKLSVRLRMSGYDYFLLVKQVNILVLCSCYILSSYEYFVLPKLVYPRCTGSDFLPRFSNGHLQFGKIVAVAVAKIITTKALHDQ